jgi:hypothetical protein
VSDLPQNGGPAGRGFTIEHPMLTVFLIGLTIGIFDFALLFPPLVYLDRYVSENTLAAIAWEWEPLRAVCFAW